MSLLAVRGRGLEEEMQATANGPVNRAAATTEIFSGFQRFTLRSQRANLALGPCGIRSPVCLTVDLPAQVFPDLVRHLKENFHDLWIELFPRPARYLFTCCLQRLRRAVRPVGSDRIESVGNGKYAGSERDLIPLQIPRSTSGCTR